VKHVLYGQKSMFLGDEATTALFDYAAHVAQLRTGARVDLRAYSDEGSSIVVTFLLNASTSLVAESTDLPLEELENGAAVKHMREQIDRFATNADFFRGFELDDGAGTLPHTDGEG
jgi:hypothetical protein